MWLNDGSLQSISNAFQMAAQEAGPLTPETSQSYSAAPSWVPITCPTQSPLHQAFLVYLSEPQESCWGQDSHPLRTLRPREANRPPQPPAPKENQLEGSALPSLTPGLFRLNGVWAALTMNILSPHPLFPWGPDLPTQAWSLCYTHVIWKQTVWGPDSSPGLKEGGGCFNGG